MRSLTLLFSFLLISFSINAQDPGFLTISSEGSVELPADVIQFNVNVNAEGNTPQKAYNLHKQREEALVRLLEKYDIEEKNIRFEPVAISKTNAGRPYNKEEAIYQTRQNVSLTLSDFEVYEQIQITLIEEGFDNFSGNFLSTEAEKGKDRALRRAISNAKEKARLIADESGVKMGNIVAIDYSHRQIGPAYARSNDMIAVQASENRLMKYDQVVTVMADITIKFEIMK